MIVKFILDADLRLDAVEELMERKSTMTKAREIMRTLPDLERLLRRLFHL